MKIGTILFTYNRPNHTKRVLDSLMDGYKHPKKLFVFQDGIREESTNIYDWEAVNHMINSINFCECKVTVSRMNKGLARSIMDGVTHICKKCDAVIVLEDDCVVDRNFMGYMEQALEFYRKNNKVMCINGFGNQGDFDPNGTDAYFTSRISSWGWGTWSDRWMNFQPREKDLYEIQQNKGLSRELALWGNDLEEGLYNSKYLKNDTWAVYWALHVLRNKGLCLMPYKSLVYNIGFDGTGVHAVDTKEFETDLGRESEKNFIFPVQMAVEMSGAKYYLSHYGGYTVKNEDESKPHIIVYGMGNYFLRNEKRLVTNYFIEGFIDRKRKGYYAGKPVLPIKEFKIDDSFIARGGKILILLLDSDEAERMRDELVKAFNISIDKIKVLGRDDIYE